MNLQRVLEPEVMDTFEEAIQYDAMDHGEVNRAFVDDLLAARVGAEEMEILDVGTGTALIPVELCKRLSSCRVMAIDMAAHMLDLARYHIEIEDLRERIMLDRIDAKQLPWDDGHFDVVMSNSIVHHIPNPLDVLAECLRVTKPGGLLFLRDLLRPADDATLQRLVQAYAGDQNEHQRQMFADSLHAALNLDEIRKTVRQLGFPESTVSATSDRHWTWVAEKPA